MADVVCTSCPNACRLAPGAVGACRVRAHRDGAVVSTVQGQVACLAVDPIEKKPLHHAWPGTRTFSFACAGCTLHCRHCQNASLSQTGDLPARTLSPDTLPRLAREAGCPSVSATYSEPMAWWEYTRDVFAACRAEGVKTVLVSSAWASPAPWAEVCRLTDAANLDLKAFDDAFYREVCGGRLDPVLANLVTARDLGVHVEITTLVIPGRNDDERQIAALAAWVAQRLGTATVLHLSRFHPQHRETARPATPLATLQRAAAIARAEGLHHVHLGNVAGDADTRCAGCNATLIERDGFTVRANHLADGACPRCRRPLEGRWT